MSYQNYIKSEFSGLTIEEILKREPSVLLGVSTKAAENLALLKILTVFDLGLSSVFDNAVRIFDGSQHPNSIFRKFRRPPTAIVDKDLITITETTDLPFESIEALIGIGPNNATGLQDHLSVKTVRDVALWPPFLAAKAIVLEAYNPGIEIESDPEAPETLIPKSGEYGTERYVYSSVVMFPDDNTAGLASLNNRLFDIVDAPEAGFKKMRFGARMTYSHTWFPKRVAKGQLLHSLPLAPGESTKVAVIGWTNKSSAATRQTLSESEKLSNISDRARSVSQIANTVANEFQSGSSQSASHSSTVEAGAVGLVPFVAGVGTVSGGFSESGATTHTVSSGSRDINTHLQQNIQDSTQQTASSVRSQRASVVSEVSQSQSEQLSTRTVTNYNHMHALTIQYYEVVQIYETQVRLEEAERCIFVPMKLVDFTDERNIFKHLKILRSAALNHSTRARLDELADAGYGYEFGFEVGRDPREIPIPLPGIRGLARQVLNSVRQSYRRLDRDGFIEFTGIQRLKLNPLLQLNHIRWRQTSSSLIRKMEIETEDGDSIILGSPPGQSAPPDTVHPALNGGESLSFGKIRRFIIHANPGFSPNPAQPNHWIVPLELAVKLNGESRWMNCGFIIDPDRSYNGRPVIEISGPPGPDELADALMEDQLHYSQAIWRRENPQTLIMQLAPYLLDVGSRTIKLVDHIAPVPLKFVGNYVVYRFTFEEDDGWRGWIHKNADTSRVAADHVAVPTGGVFAEAVPGRFNAAEKIDVTRFFNWQESPPDAPPGVAPLKAGEHTPTAAPEVGSFEKPLVSIQAPLSLPDPTGLSEALKAVAAAGLFRNMSGDSVTKEAATDATEASSEAGIAALTASGAALATTMSNVGKVLSTLGSSDGLKTLSAVGALLNQKAETEGKKTPAGNGAGGEGAAKTAPPRDPSEIVDDALEKTFMAEEPAPATGGAGSAAAPAPPTIGKTSTKAEALAHVAALTGGSGSSPWKLGRTQTFDRLKQLINNPDLIDQDSLNLCGPAAFLRLWIARDPLAVAKFAGELYETGRSSINGYEVAPDGDSLIAKDYAALKTAHGPDFCPEAEWMIMGSLRDAENIFFDFEGTPDETLSGATFPSEMQTWLRSTGLYATVQDEANLFLTRGLDHALSLTPGPGRDVALLINAHMLAQMNVTRGVPKSNEFILNAFPNHYILLTAPIAEMPGEKLQVHYWTWGQQYTGLVDRETFRVNYYGAVMGAGPGA
ncbi:MAG: hypothetical protein GF355_02500 [Candidatus Eisenbacteria bacterium]|nr:hypothetical protein [Candidatus Eisenbacteria bacterium]